MLHPIGTVLTISAAAPHDTGHPARCISSPYGFEDVQGKVGAKSEPPGFLPPCSSQQSKGFRQSKAELPIHTPACRTCWHHPRGTHIIQNTSRQVSSTNSTAHRAPAKTKHGSGYLTTQHHPSTHQTNSKPKAHIDTYIGSREQSSNSIRYLVLKDKAMDVQALNQYLGRVGEPSPGVVAVRPLPQMRMRAKGLLCGDVFEVRGCCVSR